MMERAVIWNYKSKSARNKFAKHARSLFQRYRLRANIFAEALALQRCSDRRRVVVALQIVEQCLALLPKAELEELDERFGLYSQLCDARRHHQAQHAGVDFRRRSECSWRQGEEVLHSRVH